MSTVKTIGKSGQIALGKEHAGRHVLVEEVEPGVWLIKLVDFVPESERWLHRPEVEAVVDRAIRWAYAHPPAETELADLEARVGE